MANTSFHEKPKQLQDGLERRQEIDETNREYLQHLARDIQSALKAPDADKVSSIVSLPSVFGQHLSA